MAARYKPTVIEICSASVGLDPLRGRGVRRAFTLNELRQLGSRNLAKRVAWLKQHKIIQGTDRGPFALTDKGVKVVDKACAALGKQKRRQ